MSYESPEEQYQYQFDLGIDKYEGFDAHAFVNVEEDVVDAAYGQDDEETEPEIFYTQQDQTKSENLIQLGTVAQLPEDDYEDVNDSTQNQPLYGHSDDIDMSQQEDYEDIQVRHFKTQLSRFSKTKVRFQQSFNDARILTVL